MKKSWYWITEIRSKLLIALLLNCSIVLASVEQDTQRGIEAYNRQDVVDAINWFTKAARAGYAEAQVRLAYIYDKAEENVKAVYWYRLAAEQGNAEGQYGLSQMYSSGEGVELDINQAATLLQRSAAGGFTDAVILLALSYERGELGLNEQHDRAVSLYTKAATNGDVRAIRRLQQAYARGELGLPVDKQQSAYWGEQLKPAVANK